jgi:hypothetical protein
MSGHRHKPVVGVAAFVALLLVACVIEDDLRINADGSGSYRFKMTIPKELSDGFGDMRQKAEAEGFTVEEGETDKERFIVLSKDFTDIAALNGTDNHFELTSTSTGFLRRDYRLRGTVQSLGYGSFKRHLIITMPGSVMSSDQGEINGSSVRWDATRGGTIEIAASGFYLPLSRNLRLLMALLALASAALFVMARRRRGVPAAAVCPGCRAPLAPDARFCPICGAGAPVTQV